MYIDMSNQTASLLVLLMTNTCPLYQGQQCHFVLSVIHFLLYCCFIVKVRVQHNNMKKKKGTVSQFNMFNRNIKNKCKVDNLNTHTCMTTHSPNLAKWRG